MREQFLVFGAPLIDETEINEVVDSLRSGWLGTGPKVARFEELFRQYVGSEHAVAVNSCTAGLHLSMLVAGLGPGDDTERRRLREGQDSLITISLVPFPPGFSPTR